MGGDAELSFLTLNRFSRGFTQQHSAPNTYFCISLKKSTVDMKYALITKQG